MDLASIFIIGFIVLGVYKIFELLVRRKERLMFIEKFFTHCANSEITESWKLPDISFEKREFGSLKISLLMIGLGIGCFLTFLTMMDRHVKSVYEIDSLVCFSYIAIFGGIGLLIAHFIEVKQSKNK
ncbi:MAG: hypothetical protein LBK97_07935 [Prevotellaceae bacterium]|jgi:hypothetical protein|nr:hypothetical protein [Prevotellaceae bacterium]